MEYILCREPNPKKQLRCLRCNISENETIIPLQPSFSSHSVITNSGNRTTTFQMAQSVIPRASLVPTNITSAPRPVGPKAETSLCSDLSFRPCFRNFRIACGSLVLW